MDSQAVKIEKLEELINSYTDKNQKVTNTKISRLTAPGENFGSIILKVDLTLQNEQNKSEELSIVAKLIPNLEFFRIVFNVQVTFKLETAFYDIIIPTLREFQREQGVEKEVDFYPKFYGARMNLNGSDKIDSDAVILLENLKVAGYYNLDRHVGCNNETTKLILKDLAQFHAVPVALKLKKPKTFEGKIKKNMACFYPPPPDFDKSVPNAVLEDIIRENADCVPLIPKLKKSAETSKGYNMKFREPFASITHQDLWMNNFMVRSEEGKVVCNKFVDFQTCTYDSPVRDLLFFLFTSVEFNILKEHLDDFLDFYHKNFVRTLEELGCSVADFSEEKFMEEIYHFGKYEIHHILFMYLFIVTGKKGGATPPKNDKGAPGIPPLPKQDEVPLEAKEKAWWILQEFEKRSWL